jgi:hypothetical protein
MTTLSILHNVLSEHIPDLSLTTMTHIEESLKTYPEYQKFLFSSVQKKVEHRRPRTVKPAEESCSALVWKLEDGLPKRCSSKFTSTITKGDRTINLCKIHAAKSGNICDDCSAIKDTKCIHEYRYEHLGTVDDRSVIWSNENCIRDLERVYGKSKLSTNEKEVDLEEEVDSDSEFEETYEKVEYEGKTYYKDSNNFVYKAPGVKTALGIYRKEAGKSSFRIKLFT